MQYFIRLLSTVGWIWTAIFAVSLVVVLKMKSREGAKDAKDNAEEQKS